MSTTLQAEQHESTELTTTQGTPVTPMALLQVANSRGASIEQMAQLLDLQERYERNLAQKAFNEAMNRFKANPPKISKDVSKKAGQMDLNYASLENIVNVLTPALSAVGLRHNWTVDQAGGVMTVTCILTHEQGHSESVTMSGPYDQSGGKNAIQAIASANTYLKRYTLFAATGLAAGGELEDDGQAAGKTAAPRMDQGALLDWLSAIEAASSKEEVVSLFQQAYKVADKAGDKDAIKALIAAKDKRKAAL